MRIACLGGGPAGLYFAIAMKLRDPGTRSSWSSATGPTTPSAGAWCSPTRRWPTSGAPIPVSAEEIRRAFVYWDDIAVHYRGTRHALVGARLLRHRAQAAAQHPAGPGPRARRRAAVRDRDRQPRALSRLRPDRRAPTARTPRCAARWRTSSSRTSTCAPAKYIWLGTHQKFDDAFTFIFEETEHGWIWAHAYQFDADTATFIVECSEATWRRFGFDRHEPGGDDRRLRADLRQEPRRPSADDQRPASARLGLAQLQPRAVRDAGRTRTSC